MRRERASELHSVFAKLFRWRPKAFGCVAYERLGSLYAVFVRELTQSGSYLAVTLIGCWWQKSTRKVLTHKHEAVGLMN